jgi:hypothetical protein
VIAMPDLVILSVVASTIVALYPRSFTVWLITTGFLGWKMGLTSTQYHPYGLVVWPIVSALLATLATLTLAICRRLRPLIERDGELRMSWRFWRSSVIVVVAYLATFAIGAMGDGSVWERDDYVAPTPVAAIVSVITNAGIFAVISAVFVRWRVKQRNDFETLMQDIDTDLAEAHANPRQRT